MKKSAFYYLLFCMSTLFACGEGEEEVGPSLIYNKKTYTIDAHASKAELKVENLLNSNLSSIPVVTVKTTLYTSGNLVLVLTANGSQPGAYKGHNAFPGGVLGLVYVYGPNFNTNPSDYDVLIAKSTSTINITAIHTTAVSGDFKLIVPRDSKLQNDTVITGFFKDVSF